MTWIKLDDRAPRHPKIAGLSDRAFRGWVQGLCYASEFLTDGLLPIVFTKTVTQRCTAELLNAGLWVLRDDCIHIHDYLAHQTARESVERERERNKRRRAGGTAGRTAGTTAGRTAEVPRPENRDQSTEEKTPLTPLAGGRSRRLTRAQLRSVPYDPNSPENVAAREFRRAMEASQAEGRLKAEAKLKAGVQ